MCSNKKWIENFYTGSTVLVNCGHCAACKQEKANKRTTRINLQSKFDVPKGFTTLFITLTYDNDTVPYILKSDYESFVLGGNDFIPVYRDYNKFIVRDKDKDGKRRKKKTKKINVSPLAIFSNYDMPNGGVDFRTFYNNHCKKIENVDTIRYTEYRGKKHFFSYDKDRVGVIYYHDVQNFIKRYRVNLKRHYKIYESIHFFACSEYGGISKRPHHHLLLHVPERFIEECKNAVAESWPFDNLGISWRFEKQVQIATNAASYVSSYVNCDSSIPFFLQTFRPFKPKHCYSQGYGMGSNLCELSTVLSMSEKRDFSYKRLISFNGVPTICDVPIPAYIVNRYFPKYKGFSRLSPLVSLVLIQDPKRFKEWAYALDYSREDLHKIRVSLVNHYIKYCNLLKLDYSLPVNLYLYAKDFISVHSRYSSFLNRYGYKDLVSVEDYIYHFNNWNTNIKHGLKDYLLSVYKDANYEKDVNLFPSNLSRDFRLTEMYNNYLKDKRAKNALFSVDSNV